MILIINTVPRDYFSVLLTQKRGDFKIKKVFGSFHQAEKLLPAIDQILKKEKVKNKDLRGIGVVVGPGGFTSVRVGVAVANSLGYSLNLPIIGMKATEIKDDKELAEKIYDGIKNAKKKNLVEPIYDREPNITIKIK
jgi:tRNA threonylcarbamoyl adenosine modification protein YeaZ